MATLDWWQYSLDELLCPCCGSDGKGNAYRVCAEYPEGDIYRVEWQEGDHRMYLEFSAHYMACERYRFSDDLCANCA